MPLFVPRIRAICFDVDGTLSDTDDQFVRRLKGLLHPIRFLFRRQDTERAARRIVMWAEAPGNFLISLPDVFGLDDEIAAVVEWINRHHPRTRKHFPLVPGVGKMLQGLSARYPLAIVSARDDRSTRLFLEQFGLTSFFKVIVTAQTASHTKPYPDPIQYAARMMDVSPESCLMVGDTTVDIRAGKKAGAQTVGVLCGFGEEPELRRQGADMILETTSDLSGVLGSG